MKKLLLRTLGIGLVLAVGLFGYRLWTDRSSAASAGQEISKSSDISEQEIAETPASSAEKDLAASYNAVTRPGSSEQSADVVISPDSRLKSIYQSQILEKRITDLPDGRKKRELLVQSGGKYPYRRVEELLVQNEDDTWNVDTRKEMVADHVLVKLQEGQTKEDLETLLHQYDLSIRRELSLPGVYIVSLEKPTLDGVPDAISIFSQEPGLLAYAEPDYIARLNAVPDDTNWGDLWGLRQIDAVEAWDTVTGSSNITVAVIDTGVDLDHPDLEANLWRNAAEINGTEGVDDDGNGYPDDAFGWDFAEDDSVPEPANDDDVHGTHCAGTVGAVGNNQRGVAGVCWTVQLMALRGGSTADGLAQSDTAAAVRYASDNGADVISASYGGIGFSQTARAAIEYANEQGVLFVAAAGNDGSNNDTVPQYPAGYNLPNIISVAATDQNDQLADFSNYGKTSVDLAAPGVDILSTVPGGTYDSLQGTSMATPHVAGAAALLLSADPVLTHLQVRQALLETVDRTDELASKTVSGGRLNVLSLITLQDSDEDGMPDDWETENSLNPNNSADAATDPDGDHLSNLGEYENRCDPNDADTDDDSLVDGWEVTYGFNPNTPPGSLSLSSSIGRFSTLASANNIFVSGNYAYLADGTAGLLVVNISDPENPEFLGSYDTSGEALDVAVSNGYAYVADGSSGLAIIDVSDPYSPELKSTYSTGDARGVTTQGDYVYIANGSSNDLVIVDISDPEHPLKVGSHPGYREMFDVYIDGSFAYVAVDRDVKRYDITNPSTPVMEFGYSGGPSPSSDIIGVHGNSEILALAAGPDGVIITDTNLVFFSRVDTSGSAADVFVDGNYVYVADGTNGLIVLDVATPSSPVEVLHLETAGDAVGVFVSGGYTYVTEGSDSVEVFSILSDADGDGLLDSWERSWFGDLSRDGIRDYDSDGISDWGEYLADLDPLDDDQDNDGLIDGTQEIIIYNSDPRDADTDDDGLDDGAEVNASYSTDPVLADTDGDGMNDGWENTYGFNPLDIFDPGPDGDADSDGLTNLEESEAETDPTDSDTDNDGMPDGWEVDNNLDPLTDDSALDPDEDDLTNLEEYTLTTHPQNSDSDGDGMDDGWEYAYGLDPLSDTDASVDSDADGLSNLMEYQNQTDPIDDDTDNDNMPDGWEVDNYLDPLTDNATADPDADGLQNIHEYSLSSSNLWQGVYTSVVGSVMIFSYTDTNSVTVEYIPGATNPNEKDSDGDGLTDLYEIITNGTSNLYITNPNSADTDNDGLPDTWELAQDPVSDPTSSALSTDDSDGDGLTNGEEDALGTDSANANDPIFVDDDGPGDTEPNGGAPYDPTSSDPDEDGTRDHPFDSIQEAINISSNGITILVNDGEYVGEGNYNIDFQGKDITVKSWNDDPTNTVVNSLGYGPVFSLNSSETTNSLIQGLGITVTLSDCSDGDCDHEHAVVLSNASPRIVNCRIFNAQLDGIHAFGNSRPVIENCVITNLLNGIWCEGGASPQISGSQIADIGHGQAGDVGIGIYIDSGNDILISGDSVVSNCNGRGILLKDCGEGLIQDTTVVNSSGGMTLDNSSPDIDRCIIQNNSAPNYFTIDGFGVISHSVFPLGLDGYEDITDEDENGAGILLLRGSSPWIQNCLITDNRTWADDPDYRVNDALVPDFGLGAGLYVGENCSPTGVNCTVAGNHAQTRGGGLSSYQSPFLRNMIFWDNTSSDAVILEGDIRQVSSTSEYRNLHCRSGSINIWYSDIENGYPTAWLSTTNDPLLTADYHLASTNSAAYNRGTFYLAPLVDLDGNARSSLADWPDRIDMGCYEYGASPSPDPVADADSVSTSEPTLNLSADTDGDGFTDGTEMTLGTDRYDSDDYFRVYHEQSLSENGSVLVAWESVSDCNYSVQWTDNLVVGGWNSIEGQVDLPGTGDVMFYSEDLPETARYYRVLVEQP